MTDEAREQQLAKKRAYRLANREKVHAYQVEYTAKNRGQEKLRARAYRAAHPEKVAETVKRYRTANRHKIREYERALRANNPGVRLARNLRARLYDALKCGTKGGSPVRDLGCSIRALQLHLELRFAPGMSWANYGQWHVDHKRPLAAFDLTVREQLLMACHYSNLQPLWAVDNLRKGAQV